MLEAIRGALAPFVDEAMTRAYGQHWDDVVAADDAKRRSNGRKFPVAKNDLYVLLRVLMHRRIEPWATIKTYPRIRAFAGEVLSLRNLHAHGDDCLGEYTRLVDTGRRMLEMLTLPIPDNLKSVDRQARPALSESNAALLDVRPQIRIGRLDAEIATLGEEGEQLLHILARAFELSTVMLQDFNDGLARLDPQDPDWGTFSERTFETSKTAGAEVLELLTATDRIETERSDSLDPRLEVLGLAARCQLLTPLLASAAGAHLSALESQAGDLYSADVARIAELIESSQSDDALALLEDSESKELLQRVEEGMRLLAPAGSTNIWRELIQAASRLDDASPIGNIFVAFASIELAASAKDGEGNWTNEALPHIQEAILRLRFEAGTEPGSTYESVLVRALRFEGEIYSDLGRSDEALRSFARADEIVDRYPAADPAIHQ